MTSWDSHLQQSRVAGLLHQSDESEALSAGVRGCLLMFGPLQSFQFPLENHFRALHLVGFDKNFSF